MGAKSTVNRPIRSCFDDWWEGTLDLQRVHFDSASRIATFEIEFADYGQEVEVESKGLRLSRRYQSPVFTDDVQVNDVVNVEIKADGEIEIYINDLNFDGRRLLFDGSNGTVAIETTTAQCSVTRTCTSKTVERRVYLGGLFNSLSVKQSCCGSESADAATAP